MQPGNILSKIKRQQITSSFIHLMPCLHLGFLPRLKEFTYQGKFLVNVNIN